MTKDGERTRQTTAEYAKSSIDPTSVKLTESAVIVHKNPNKREEEEEEEERRKCLKKNKTISIQSSHEVSQMKRNEQSSPEESVMKGDEEKDEYDDQEEEEEEFERRSDSAATALERKKRWRTNRQKAVVIAKAELNNVNSERGKVNAKVRVLKGITFGCMGSQFLVINVLALKKSKVLVSLSFISSDMPTKII